MTTGTLTAAEAALLGISSASRGIPAVYLAAFGEGGAAAATPFALVATVVALPALAALLGYSIWDLYKIYQQSKVIAAQIAASQAEVALAKQAIADYNAVHAQYLESIKKLEEWAQDTGGAAVPQVVTITKPKPEPEIIVTPVVEPVPVVTVTPPLPGKTTVVPAGQPITIGSPQVNVTVQPSPAPFVEVNVPEVPQPLAVTGPLTAVSLAAIAPIIATAFATQQKQTTQGCFESTGALLLGNILRSLVPAGIAAGFMFNSTLQNAMSSVVTKFVEAIYSPLTKQAPITPEKAPGIGAVLLGQAVMFGSGAHIMSIMAEASAPLKTMGLGYLAAFLADAAGFSRIAAAYQGMMIQVGLSQPMKYWAQERFRPEIPSEGYLLRLAGEYAIDRGTFSKYMSYHGFTQEWIDKLWELADRPFSPMLFRFLANAGELPEELLDRELKNAGYNAASIPPLKTAFTRLAAGELQGQFAGAVTSAYNKGLLEPGEFDDHLANLGYSEKQRGRAAYSAELSFATNIAEEMRAVYLQQHKLGQLTDGELGLQLTTLGYRSEKVSADGAKARAWFKPKPEPKADPAIEKAIRDAQTKYVSGYIELYRDGYLDDDGLYNALVLIGVDPGVAQATVFLEGAKTLPALTE